MAQVQDPWNALRQKDFGNNALEDLSPRWISLSSIKESLWKKGSRDEALEHFAEARECTSNGIVHLELDKFLKDKKEPGCEGMPETSGEQKKKKDEAFSLMELWKRLMPEDSEIDGAFI